MASKAAANRAPSKANSKAMQDRRRHRRTVSKYLSALEERKANRKPGRPRNVQSITGQLNKAEDLKSTATGLQRLEAIQTVEDLTEDLEQLKKQAAHITTLENEFISIAKEFGELKGISYKSWCKQGVEEAVLERAGIRKAAQ